MIAIASTTGIMAFVMALGFCWVVIEPPICLSISFIPAIWTSFRLCFSWPIFFHFDSLLCSSFLYFLDFCHYCLFDSYFYCLKVFPSSYFVSKDFPH